MKRITSTALFTLAALVTTAGAMAQGRAVRATVPFNFTVGDKLLPAGTYEISKPSAGIIELQIRDKHVTMLTAVNYDSKVKQHARMQQAMLQTSDHIYVAAK
jgi:hypothetical protein